MFEDGSISHVARDEFGHILPHGGKLVDLFVRDQKLQEQLIASSTHKKECTERNACDVELLSVGGFSPLTGFMNRDVYDSVVDNMRCDSSS
jgi:sulfate adenylyltransferase